MYRVILYENPYKQDGIIINEPRSYNEKVLQGNISLKLTNVATATFVLPMNNPGFTKVKTMTSFVQVIDHFTDEVVFYGRISTVSTNLSNSGLVSKTIRCEAKLAFLLDSTQLYKNSDVYSIQSFLKILLDEHNEQVEPYKYVYAGNITVKDPQESSLYVSTDSTLGNIREKLVSKVGGFLQINHRDGANYLDYSNDVGKIQNTPILLGKNVSNATKEISVDGLFTRIFPLGKERESNANEHEKPRINIADINDGRTYLDDDLLVKQFGIIGKQVVFENTTDKKTLKVKGEESLKQQRTRIVSWSIGVVELSLLDISYDRIRLGDKYPIHIPLLGEKEVLQVVQKDINILEPAKSNLTFGKGQKKLTDLHPFPNS